MDYDRILQQYITIIKDTHASQGKITDIFLLEILEGCIAQMKIVAKLHNLPFDEVAIRYDVSTNITEVANALS